MARDTDKEGNRPSGAEDIGFTTRRVFLKAAVTVSALPIVASAGRNPAQDRAARPPSLYKAIFDERFAAGRAFAARARQLGMAASAIRADITAVWFHDLHVRWQKGAAAIAGLTAPSALFCLERLAWDHGMRAVFQAEHRRSPAGEVQHAVLRGSDLLAAADLDAAGAKWVTRLAELVTHYPLECVRSAGPAAAGLPWAADDDAVTLTSWVIAPIKRA